MEALGLAISVLVLELVTAGTCIALLRPDRQLDAREPSSRRVLKAYGYASWIQGLDFLSILALLVLRFTGLMTVYITVRWCAGARAGRHAIVYLRSFHGESAGRVFSSVVIPALQRTVPVTGLVHIQQSASKLNREVPLLWRSRFASISDSDWQDWVTDHLKNAVGAVIDLSVPSAATNWELQTARTLLPPERVLVIHDGTETPEVDVKVVAYDLSTRESTDRARRAVRDWLSEALTKLDPLLSHRKLPVSRPRKQLPVVALLILGPVTASACLGDVVERMSRALTRERDAAQRRYTQWKSAPLIPIQQTASELFREAHACPTYEEAAHASKFDSTESGGPEAIGCQIECNEVGVVVRCKGPDARLGTDDDLVAGSNAAE